jgi:hypothetical protein
VKKSVLVVLILAIVLILALLFIFLRAEKQGDFFRFLAKNRTKALSSENFTFDVGL